MPIHEMDILLEELEPAPYEPIDARAVLRHGMAALGDLPRPLESGSLEERKEFVRAFIAGIKVYPDEERLEVHMRKIPASVLPKPGYSSVGLVTGARNDRVQRNSLVLSVHMRRQDLIVTAAA